MGTDLSGIAGNYSVMKMIKQQGEIQTLVLRKALDQQNQAAETLLDTMPQQAVSNPPHLGNSVDLYV